MSTLQFMGKSISFKGKGYQMKAKLWKAQKVLAYQGGFLSRLDSKILTQLNI